MSQTELLNLPYIAPAQAQKHVTHNESIRALDALVQLSVISASVTAPPATPAPGARYIIAAGATGAWTGMEGRVAAWQDGAWFFYEPNTGWVAWVADEQSLFVRGASSWAPFAAQSAASAPMIGVNTTASTTNRLSVASDASLFNHAGSGHQLKINKAAPAGNASVLYQTGFSGRAEAGLSGDEDWQLKVSADGSNWNQALLVDRANGRVRFSAGAEFPTGTFVPILGTVFTGAYAATTAIAVSYARHTRIGNLCFCRMAFTLTGASSAEVTAGSAFHLRMLPFPISNLLLSAADQAGSGSIYRSPASGQATALSVFLGAPDNLYVFAHPTASANARGIDTHFLNFSYEVA